MDGDVSRSQGGKRKASYDAPEKTRKIRKCSDYLEVSLPVGEILTAACTSNTSDPRYVGLGSPQELIQSEAEDGSYLVPVHNLHQFPSDGLTALISPHENYAEQLGQAAMQEDQHVFHENLTPQEAYFEEYLKHRVRIEDMFDTPPLPTWQPSHNPDPSHGLVLQHGYGESFVSHQGQHDLAESFTPHFEYPPERLAEISSFDSFSDLESKLWLLSGSEC